MKKAMCPTQDGQINENAKALAAAQAEREPAAKNAALPSAPPLRRLFGGL